MCSLKTMLKLTCMIMLLFVSSSEQMEKKPSWAVGRSLDSADESSSAEGSQPDWYYLQQTADKRPSWAVGRDLSEISGDNEVAKRIIEFKRGWNSNHNVQNDEFESILSHKLRAKRPSIGRTRSVSSHH